MSRKSAERNNLREEAVKPEFEKLSSLVDEEEDGDEVSDRYLVFYLGQELYAASLLSIMEVIKLGQVKSVPYTSSHFTGVLNLRGQIVSVIDLRKRFGITPQGESSPLVLVVPDGDMVLGMVVDDVYAVERISDDQMKSEFAVESDVPIEFLKSVSNLRENLVSIIDLNRVVSKTELQNIKRIAS